MTLAQRRMSKKLKVGNKSSQYHHLKDNKSESNKLKKQLRKTDESKSQQAGGKRLLNSALKRGKR